MQRVRELTDKPFGVDLLTAVPESLTRSVDVIIDGGAKAFIAGLGIPNAILARLKDAGLVVMSMCGSVRHAQRAEQAGVDAVVAQGTEAGGHTGKIGALALVPQVVDAVSIPTLAAGAIFDGRGRPRRSRSARKACGWARASSPRARRMRQPRTSRRSWRPATRAPW